MTETTLKNDLLSDLEADLSGDWEEIQKDIQDKEHEEWLKNNPQRMHFPDFKEFYKMMLDIFRTSYGNPRDMGSVQMIGLHRLLVGIFHNHRSDNPMPKAFDRVWEIFCTPHEYDCATGIKCQNCKNRWDVMFKRERMISYESMRLAEEGFNAANHVHEFSHYRVICPSCGSHIQNISGSEVIGVFKHVHVDEKEEYKAKFRHEGERGYETIQQFGNDI